MAVPKFSLVQTVASAASLPTYGLWSPSAWEQPGLRSGHYLAGVTTEDAVSYDDISVIRDGYLRDCPPQNGETWAAGDVLWGKDGGSITKTRPAAPLPLVVVGVVFEVAGGVCAIDVHVRELPSLGELSGVSVETPADLDVFIHKASTHVWEPRRLVHNTDLSGLTTAGAHPATAISNTPAGGIAATTVQAAIDELESEKAGLVLFYSLGGF